MIRIHITGAPHSGTALMQGLVSASYSGITSWDQDVPLWSSVPKEGFICTRHADDTMLAPLVLEKDKSLHFVVMMRDPRDVISCKLDQHPEHYATNLRVWRDHAKIARRLRDHPRFHIMRYEDLIETPDEAQRRLGAAMGFLVRRARFSEHAEYHAPKLARTGHWKDHIGRVKHQIKIHGSIDSDLIDFSYETNTAWLEELTFVESNPAASLMPEKSNVLGGGARKVGRFLHASTYMRKRLIGV